MTKVNYNMGDFSISVNNSSYVPTRKKSHKSAKHSINELHDNYRSEWSVNFIKEKVQRERQIELESRDDEINHHF